MNDPQRTEPMETELARSLADLREPVWIHDAHRERLARELFGAHERMRGAQRRARRLLTIGVASAALAGVAYGAGWFHGWSVTTQVDGETVGARTVEIDAHGRGYFTVPVEGLDLEDPRFDFDIEGLDAPWVTFDIRVEGDTAHVSVQEHDAPPIDPTVARAAIDALAAIVKGDGGELWGVELGRPLLFVDPETRTVVADRADAEGVLFEWKGMWAGRFPADRGIANTAVQWAGTRWTMLMWPPPTDAIARANLLVHESFHNVQNELRITAAASPCPHLATMDGRLWLRLEARALAAALRAEDDFERDEAAADAMLFRALRRSLFANGAELEDGLERVEGSAEYTGVRLCSDNASVRSARTIAALEGLVARESLTRSFAYATGPALGLLLDAYDPAWRSDFLAGRELSELLSLAVLIEEPTDLARAAAERAGRYGAAEVRAEEVERERLRVARAVVHRARFVDGPVLVLPTRTPRRSFDPNRIEPLDGVGQVYGTLWISDEWGVADAPGGALLCDDGRTHLAAPADLEGPELAGDGWTLTLTPEWTVESGARDGDYRIVARP